LEENPSTHLMHVGDDREPPPVQVGADEVLYASSYVCLDSIVTNNGDLTQEIEQRRQTAAGAATLASQSNSSQNKAVNIQRISSDSATLWS